MGISDSNRTTTTRDEALVVIADGAGTGDQAAVVSRSNLSKAVATQGEIVGKDLLGNFRTVNTVVLDDGSVGIPLKGTVVVSSTFGLDQQPDSMFTIVKTGAAGDTWTVFIRGTSGDTTSPDRDLPDYTKIFTVLPGEVGDELALRDRIITELNADSTFRTTCFLRALKHTDRATVHISSDKFSVTGEFFERPLSGDFNVTVTGTAQVVLVYDNLIARTKQISITRDLDSPGSLGLFGITGNVNVTAKSLSDLFFAEATHLTFGADLRQAGSLGTPIDFYIKPAATQLFIEHMFFSAQGNSIKWGQFFSKSGSGLTNGVLVTVKSDNIMTTFPVLKRTEDFKNRWAALSGDGANYRPDFQAGADEALAILSLPNPYLLRESGAFGSTANDDYIKISIRDDLTSGLSRFDFAAKGFEKAP